MDIKENIQNSIKRTKIITTIGPASESYEGMKALFNAGMTAIRLNFSHGNYEEWEKRIKIVKTLEKDLGKAISILLDTKGPEIRIGKQAFGKQLINAKDKVKIFTDANNFKNLECKDKVLTVSYDMSVDLKPRSIILIDDGKLKLIVDKVDKKNKVVYTTAFNKHVLKTNKRVNLPGINFSLPFLAKNDIEGIKWGCKNGIDYIAASFVNKAEDIAEIRKILKEVNREDVQILAKIESTLGVDNIDEIIKAADGIMIARGDLGLEVPYFNVPYIEKNIIRKCRQVGKLVIVATQMLETMINNPHPTRAEVTDVYYATELGADATMLSGESAVGLYPEITVKVMTAINKRAEKEFYSKVYYDKYVEENLAKKPNNDREKIAIKLLKKAKDGEYKFAVVFSETGKLLKTVSKLRPNTVIIGVSKKASLFSSFGIWHSIIMASFKEYNKISKNENYAVELAKQYGAMKNDKIFLVHNKSIKEFIIS